MACVLLSPLACSPGRQKSPEEPPNDDYALPELSISVSGSVVIHPGASRWLKLRAQPAPDVRGLRAELVETFRWALEDTSASFGASTVDAEGGFAVREAPLQRLHWGLAAVVAESTRPDAGPGLFWPTATVIWDMPWEGRKPRSDLADATAFAVPTSFAYQLQAAVGWANIDAATQGRASTLAEAGFVLGQLTDAGGQPLAGARVELSPAGLAAHTFYFSEDCASANQTATSGNGLFVVVHDAGDAAVFTYAVAGRPEYAARGAVLGRGLGVVTATSPGQQANR